METYIFIWMFVVGISSIACDTKAVTETLKLTDPKGKAGNNFGGDIASCNDIVIVGSFDIDHVTIYKQSHRTFTNVTNLPRQKVANEKFANAVACNDNFLVIVSRRNNIHIHHASEPYTHLHTIKSNFRSMSKVIIDKNNNIYLSNAYFKQYRGIVKIYRYINNWWNEIDFVLPPHIDDGLVRMFGLDIAVTSEYLVVTSPWTNYKRGAVHVYEKSSTTPVLLETIVSPTPKAGEEFGTSVGMDSEWLVIGTADGLAYIYQYVSQNTYKHIQRLQPPNIEGVKWKGFGRLVSIEDKIIVACGYAHVNKVRHSGACVVYELDSVDNTWKHTSTLLQSDPERNDCFGYYAVYINNRTIGIHSHNNRRSSRIGAVYVYFTSPTISTTTKTARTATKTTTATPGQL